MTTLLMWTPERIRALRLRRKMTQTQFAEAINERTGLRLHRHAISAWESGSIIPSAASCMALAMLDVE